MFWMNMRVSRWMMVGMMLPLGLSVSCGKATQAVTDKVAEKAVEKAVERGIAENGGNAKVDIDKNTGAVNLKGTDKDGSSFEMKSDGKDGVSMSQTSADGTEQFQYGEGAKIPDTFPKDVPLVDGMVVNAATSDTADQEYTVQGSTTKAPAEIVSYYKEKAPAQGWKELSVMDMGELQTLNYEKESDTEKRNLSVMVSTDSGKTILSISVQ